MNPSAVQLRNERSKYYVFREQINTLCTKLLENYNQYYSVHEKINEVYQINDASAENGKLQKDAKKLKESYDLLRNQTLPSIDRKIDQLSIRIREAEKLAESEAKKAAEQAEAKRQAQLQSRI
jgi:phosphoenolpyruvate carboxylase